MVLLINDSESLSDYQETYYPKFFNGYRPDPKDLKFMDGQIVQSIGGKHDTLGHSDNQYLRHSPSNNQNREVMFCL